MINCNPFDGPHCLYVADWIEQHQAEALQSQLIATIDWQQPEIVVYGKSHKTPRLQCWMGDPQCQYQYSGLQLEPVPWQKNLLTLRHHLNQQLATNFNSVLINYYRDGSDAMGWHADDEPELGPNPVVAMVTLGQQRPLKFKHRSHQQQFQCPCEHGSLMVMSAGLQSNWLHGVSKSKKPMKSRITLTYREIVF